MLSIVIRSTPFLICLEELETIGQGKLAVFYPSSGSEGKNRAILSLTYLVETKKDNGSHISALLYALHCFYR